MDALVVDSGGRGHALAWKISRSPLLRNLWIAPGNPGTASLGENVPVKPDDIDGLLAFARDKKPDLVVFGPEAPLVAGAADRLQGEGFNTFGPVQAGAMLEGSKVFAKGFMLENKIPTAEFRIARSKEEALAAHRQLDSAMPIVCKADGLAAGKGVIVCFDMGEFHDALSRYFDKNEFGDAGNQIVVERFMPGVELSVTVLCDGENWMLLPDAMDYKQREAGDKGPNTGGMGAHSPSMILGLHLHDGAIKTIIEKTIAGLRTRGIPFKGVLYVGLMVTKEGPKVVEYNVRFGDPECQALMLRLGKNDILPVLDACAQGALSSDHVFDPHKMAPASACIVVADGTYPAPVKPSGAEIHGVVEAQRDNVQLFHAGTRLEDGKLFVNGGRTLNVCATGETHLEAVDIALNAARKITWEKDGVTQYMREDIGRRRMIVGG